VQNQHSYNHRENQSDQAARQNQSHAFALEDGQLGRTHIASVLLDSQNTCAGEGLCTVLLIVSEITQGHRACAGCEAAALRPQLSQQTPFALERSDDGNATESN
jgi:hypothetical protein